MYHLYPGISIAIIYLIVSTELQKSYGLIYFFIRRKDIIIIYLYHSPSIILTCISVATFYNIYIIGLGQFNMCLFYKLLNIILGG